MKNKKRVLASLAVAAVMAIGGGALAGCGHTHTYSDKWTSDETNHWHVATCDDLKEGDKDYKSGVEAHKYGDDDKCDVCGYEKKTAPAPSTQNYTITLNANGGTLTTTSLTTVNGKITLPTPTPPANKEFDGWYTAATGGEKVTNDKVYTANTTIYAHYKDKTPDTPTPQEYTITLDANGGTLTTTSLTTVNGKITLPTPTAPNGKTFKGWYTAATGGDEVTGDKVYAANTTIYAQYEDEETPPPPPAEEYTVTLNISADGTVAEGTQLTIQTVDGKIAIANLPAVTPVDADHMEFAGWYTTATPDQAVDEALKGNYAVTENTTIYAVVLREDGLWTGTSFVKALEVNNGCTDHLQYWFGGSDILLTEGTEISAYIDGNLMTYTVFQTSSCIEVPASSARVTSVTVSEDATFVVYLNKWGENNWQIECTGIPKNVNSSSEIPDGCEAITLKFSNGDVTLYIIDNNGTAVNSENAGNYQIHAWQTGNAQMYGAWATNPKLSETDNLDLSATTELKADVIFMFHWNGGQTGNISNIAVGKSFIVDFRDNSTTELVLPEA